MISIIDLVTRFIVILISVLQEYKGPALRHWQLSMGSEISGTRASRVDVFMAVRCEGKSFYNGIVFIGITGRSWYVQIAY